MKSSQEPDQSKQLGSAALAAMTAHAVPPTPQNYAIWYGYVSGRLPALTAEIDALVGKGQSFTEEVNADLHTRHLGDGETLDLLQDTGGRLQSVIDRVRKYVGDAAGDMGSFGQTLGDFSTAIGGSAPADKMHSLITKLVQETEAMAQRNSTLESQMGKVSGELSELRENLERVQREAFTDGLTGIANRKYFDKRLREAARDAVARGTPLALLMADIDHFKRFNDSFGHQIGDKVLKLVAVTLSESLKGRDTPTRYGGEEFAVILPETLLKDGAIVAEQIRTTLQKRRLVGKDSRDSYGAVTLSFGVAQYRAGESLGDFIGRADAALYHAKREGRNRVATEKMVAGLGKAS